MQNALVRDLRGRIIRGAGSYIARTFADQAKQAYRAYQSGNYTQPSFRLRDYFMANATRGVTGYGPTRRRGTMMRVTGYRAGYGRRAAPARRTYGRRPQYRRRLPLRKRRTYFRRSTYRRRRWY